MKTNNALKNIQKFKGSSLKHKLNELKSSILKDNSFPDVTDIYNSALEIKKMSAQIDEIVHATGIIQCLPKILKKGEKVIDLSLASSGGIDLLTDKRVAEFKFSRWQKNSANGSRARGVFADLVGLYAFQNTKLKKEIYVIDKNQIVHFFETSNSSWREKLSKHKRVLKNFENSLTEKKLSEINTVSDVYKLIQLNVKVYDIELLIK
ncbi:MAG: hypothetical protein WC150_06785 [Bacteroidia bacterium]